MPRGKTGQIILVIITTLLNLNQCSRSNVNVRSVEKFNQAWRFNLGDVIEAQNPDFDDSGWRVLNLPHDWSIEGEFSEQNPATPGGGALPGGIGWYRKTFVLPETERGKCVFLDFDGVYRNGEVWINGQYLGRRPYGYSSFRYELTPFLKFGDEPNVIAVKVDNSRQPDSRWYTGSGIYRNVWLVITEKIYIDHWGTFVTTPNVSRRQATVNLKTAIANRAGQAQEITLETDLYDAAGKLKTKVSTHQVVSKDTVTEIAQQLLVKNPRLWSDKNPEMYRAVSRVIVDGKVIDDYETPFGIRSFVFDSEKGFLLNGEPVKIRGVCNHHDLGCLGAAINVRALERQLELLKAMGCNGLRTSHNPPAPELLDLCDRMGFIVMDEAFDMWQKPKTQYDYHLYFDEWHARDIADLVRRDRNHPSVFIWSIGNEVIEQYDHKDLTGIRIAQELAAIIRSLDVTRPVTAACNDQSPENPVIKSGALDLIGYNYAHSKYAEFPAVYPGKCLIGSETTSALAMRGCYDLPSDSVRFWPVRWDLPFTTGNADYSCSAYDNCHAPWGSTHAETWPAVRDNDFVSGMYVWTGFDYLGEPTPYGWPARSSYFGILDLAGFPKDAYYYYQSAWTDQPVLHIFPHWDWTEGQPIDVWAYTNCDEVELFLNEQSLGTKTKTVRDSHLIWRVNFTPGTLRAVGHKKGFATLTKTIQTADEPARILLEPDRSLLKANGEDLSFIAVKIVDKNGTLVPRADNQVNFSIEGPGLIAGVDNGSQISHEPFKADFRKAFNGRCLVVIQTRENPGNIQVRAASPGLQPAEIFIHSK